MLEVRNVTKAFFPHTINEKIALANVSLKLDEGEFVTVIGSNGAGKSTLLNVVAGVYRPDTGSIWIDGKDVTKLPDNRVAKLLGRVFQDPMSGTAPHLTIEQNLAIAYVRGTNRGLCWGVGPKRRKLFREELALLELGLEDRLHTKVGLLSGGQRQALSLVMATFSKPRILLLDEHTAALDPQRAELITRLTQDMVARHRLTTLMVTHNMAQALRLGDRLIMMHEGKIVYELSGEEKRKATVDDLLGEFEKVKVAGAAEFADRSLLN